MNDGVVKISAKETIKKRLLSELITRCSVITVTELAQLVEKTGRTVRSYLDELEAEYKEYGFEIVRKTNVGVYVKIDEENRNRLLNSLKENKAGGVAAESFSSKYRQVYILKTLFEDKYSYTIQTFASELYCSKSTIVNELTYVQKWLEDHKLTLRRRQNQGLWIEGNEKDYRNALKDLLDELQEKEDTCGNLDEGFEELDYRIDLVNYTKVKSMFPKIDFYYIQRVLQEAEKELGFYFTDQAFLNLIIHIAITIERLKNHKPVSSNDNYYEELSNEQEYRVAKWVVEELSKKFGVSFPEEEIGYISIHMLGAKIQENYDEKKNSNIIDKQDINFVELAKSIIAMYSDILNVDLAKDEGLLTRLVLHLRPTIIRLKYGLKLTNPMLERIKQEYTSIFGAAWASSSIFEKKFGVSINEDEVGYLALHLALSVENIKSKIRTIVVCSSGIGTSQLVASKLVRKFDNLDITHILPFNLLSPKLMEEADLIISTIRNVRPQEKVVYISTLVDDKDLVNIENTIKRLKRNNSSSIKSVDYIQDESAVEKENNSIFDKELCFLDSELTDFVQAVAYYGKLMEERGYAKLGFHEDILSREKLGSTYVGKGISIPHARDMFVKKSKVCVVRFKKPVIWQGNQLDFMFILCLKFSDIKTTKKFFSNFYSVLENDEVIARIKETESIDDIIYVFDEVGGSKINNL
jgi:transcriptional antiterminator